MKPIGDQNRWSKQKKVTNEAYWCPKPVEQTKKVTNEAYWRPKSAE